MLKVVGRGKLTGVFLFTDMQFTYIIVLELAMDESHLLCEIEVIPLRLLAMSKKGSWPCNPSFSS